MFLLVIPCLPFARPDALKEKVRESFPDLHSFIRAVVVPEIQITNSLQTVEDFIRSVKGPGYSQEMESHKAGL